jgi:hypothetical protein
MLSPERSQEALFKLFQRRRIADLELLFQTLQTNSAMSVFRRLSPLDYLTSYSHARRFYTLKDIPVFDENGLWHYQEVFFSQHGTLKATIAHLVEHATAGHTQIELRSRLRVHVHNALLDLVKNHRITRELFRGLLLYLSPNAPQAALQIECRKRDKASLPVYHLAQPLVVEVLLEIINGAQLVSEPADIVARLSSRDIKVTLADVELIFQQHGLKKTPGRRYRSWQR